MKQPLNEMIQEQNLSAARSSFVGMTFFLRILWKAIRADSDGLISSPHHHSSSEALSERRYFQLRIDSASALEELAPLRAILDLNPLDERMHVHGRERGQGELETTDQE